jgi:hypothetical protein
LKSVLRKDISPSGRQQKGVKKSQTSPGGILLLETGTDHVQDPFFVGKLARFKFGIDQVAVQRYFETSASGRDQRKILNLLLVRG